MTDYEFTRLDFDKSPDEMDADELRETLVEFEEKHTENAATFDTIQADLPDREEYESLKTESAEFKGRLVTEVAESSPLAEDDLADFSMSRLYELRAEFAEDAEAAEEAAEEEEEEPDDEEPAFTQESKESRAGAFSEDGVAARSGSAKEMLSGMSGLALE